MVKTLNMSQRRILWRSLNYSDVLDTTVKEKENSLENSPAAKSHSVNMTNMWNKCSKKPQICPNADDLTAKVH